MEFRRLVAMRDAAGRQIAEFDRCALALARRSACRRLVDGAGVGAITALALAAVIDQPRRFATSSTIAAYLGLTARRQQSGEVGDAGRIPRRGDGRAVCTRSRSRCFPGTAAARR